AGVLLQARFQEAGQDFKVGYGYDPDTARKSVTYPSGVTVHQDRDQGGRLRRVYDGNGDIIRVDTWQGNEEAKDVTLGNSIHLVNQFDARGRLTASRYTRSADGAVLAHLRYQYDAANNLEARQFLHRLGRADSFSFDSGERLSSAQVGGIPTVSSGSAARLYDRSYAYHLSGLDYLTTAVTTNYGGAAPAFASVWTAHDAFLQPTLVDGFTRGAADPLGNVQQAQLWTRSAGNTETLPVSATLVHNGDGRLTRITRSDGIVEDNYFQPGGLRYLRRLTLNGQTLENRSYVYDDKGRLLEEFEPSNSVPQVVCRYFYASDDAPVAADLLDPDSRQLKRYFFLRDGAGSPVCVADASGTVLERIQYDPFGQPEIQARDSRPPVLKQVVSGTNGSLLAVLSEPVWSPTNDPGPGVGIVRFPAPSVQDALTVSLNSTNIAGTTELLASLPGYEPYSVLRFTPSQSLPTTPSSLVAWWPGDVSALDVAGGHNGTLKGGVTNGPGLLNQAFRFNGVNGFVEIPDHPSLNSGLGDFTVSLWAYFSDATAQQVLIEKWVQSSRAGWSLLKTSGNRLRLALGDGAGNEQDIDSGTLALPVTNWVHLAVRRQGSTFGVFTNGVAVATGTHAAGLTSSSSLKFGAREGTSAFLNGAMDEVTLYNRALTDAELTAVVAGVSAPGPVTVSLASGVLSDEWGNLNAGASRSFLANNQSQPGTVYYSAEPEPRTAPGRLARSALGSAILFHGQYFDYESGLLYLRARFYDPFSAMFFEPDPAGYEDSVNLYAGLANNPVSNRDPTGLGVQSWEWEYISSGFGLAQPQRKVQVFTAEQEARRALKRRNTSWNFLEVETTQAGRAKVEERLGRSYALWQAEMDLETYTGHRRVMLGLDPFVQATEQHWGGNQFMSLSVAFADEQVDRAIEQTANRQLRAGLRPRLIINVEGWVGGSLEEKINASITRGARAYPDEAAGFRLAHAPEFKMEPHLEIPVKEGEEAKIFSVTDKEMYRAYRAGALEHAIFVSGKEGENIVRGQSKLRALFRSIRE
ncbi:MAG TPA: LamG-like jellyroll fold domain-containing protein, partial [Verrucomicrobiae bacterium]|nr:LamG-like jellyroll fold domain-containing protein [Verrucomicrobiae bacterium]